MENCLLGWQVRAHSAISAEVQELAATPELLFLVRMDENIKPKTVSLEDNVALLIPGIASKVNKNEPKHKT